MNPGNQIWILLAFVALSFLQWLIRRLQEQSAINKKKQAEARRREEILRTGRDPDQQNRAPDTASVSAEAAARQARLRELRQKQLEEMRRKGQPRPAPSTQARVPTRAAPTQATGRSAPVVIGPGAGSGPPPTRPQRQTIGAPQPPRPKPTQPTQPQRRPAAATPPPQQRSRNLPATSARPAGTEAPPPPRRTRPAAAPGALRDTTTPQSLASTPLISEIPEAAAQGASSATRGVGAGMTAADWRRALILGEVLAPPVSLRTDR